MSTDQLFGVVAILAMLILVVPGLLRSSTPRPKMMRMAALWLIIIAVITGVVMLVQRGN